MRPMASIERQLRERGVILRARHDDSIIADVIGEIERLDSENAEISGQILRTMVGWEE